MSIRGASRATLENLRVSFQLKASIIGLRTRVATAAGDHRIINTASLSVACAILSGCATMSPEDCLQANWEDIGYQDAMESHSVSRSQAHREACGETGVDVDFELYRYGYSLGLPYYCTR